MFRWYLVHRYYFSENKTLLLETIDGVYCSCISRALDIAKGRNCLAEGDKLRVEGAYTQVQAKLAKRLSDEHKASELELWPIDEFVQWMQV
mgnify:CR=1 FL=1